jgi:hypothetical protein
MRFPLFCLVVAVDVLLGTASFAQSVWGSKSALLDLGMTEQQVMNAIGYRPNKVEMQTCGQSSQGGPWVLFEQSPRDGAWRTNSWSVFP